LQAIRFYSAKSFAPAHFHLTAKASNFSKNAKAFIMHVVVVADPHIPIPPSGYGGAERIVAILCQGLAERGHKVDLIAGSGSSAYGGSVVIHYPPGKKKIQRAYRKILFQFLSWRACRRAQVVVSFGRVDYLWTVLRGGVPLVQVFQNPAKQSELDFVLATRKHALRFVGVSSDQMDGLGPRDLIHVVHNAASVERMVFSPAAQSPPYFAFLGRLTANKGVHLAIQAAKLANVKLVIAGNVSRTEAGAANYFESQVKPYLGPMIEYIGEVNDEAKVKLLGGATAMLFPIQWREPCALVLPEALACGCPVIAWKNGCVAEVIKHGRTGFVVESLDEMVAAIQKIDQINRLDCRRDAELRFSASHMVDEYEKIILEIVANKAKSRMH